MPILYFIQRNIMKAQIMVKNLTIILTVAAMSVVLALTAGCESDAGTGATIGGLGGAGVGAIIGHQSGHTTEGALIGGAVGAGGGYLIGNERDKKRERAESDNLRQEINTVTVNVANSNGSVTPVTLRRQGTGYVGPRGEFYNQLPTPEQLKPVYGF
jgi:hypothetical protein